MARIKWLKYALLLLAVWLLCGYIAHGLFVGESARRWPCAEPEPFATRWSYGFGPIALGWELYYNPHFYYAQHRPKLSQCNDF